MLIDPKDMAVAAPRLRIEILGPLEVRSPNGVAPLAARKDRALLAVVALAPGQTVARGRLAGLLWADSTEARARDSLKQALRRLRRAFAPIEPLIADRTSVTLAPWVEVDATLLLAAETEAEVQRAIGFRRGRLLEGIDIDQPVFQGWLRAERARIDAAFASQALGLMRRAEAAGTIEAAAEAARALLAADPLNEEAVRLLMRRHASRGERGRAVDLFRQLRDRLAEELSVEPEAATTALFREIRRGPLAAEAPDRLHEVAGRTAGLRSLVVLPFTNIGDDLTQDYFADGLAEDIATSLVRVPDLVVAAPEAVARHRGPSDPLEVARGLGVEYVLTGSVRREGGRVRLTGRLIEAAGGRQVWADRYDRDAADILSLQDDLSGAVAEALKLKLLATGEADDTSRGTSDAAAYEFYLKARSFHLRGVDGHSLEVARALYVRATDRDPGFARALAQLAICESHLSMSRGTAEDETDACVEHARQALALDPYLAEAHAALGLSLYAAGRYAEADQALETAIRLNPMLFEACFFQGRNRRLQGLRRDAADLFERAAALRPADYRAIGLFGEELQALGRQSEALDAFGRCLERLEAEVEAHPGNADALAFGAAVLADLGRREQAEEWATWSLVLGQGQRLVHYNVARTFVMLGRSEEALRELEFAFQSSNVVRRRLALWMAHDDDLAPLGSEPRFLRLLAMASPATT